MDTAGMPVGLGHPSENGGCLRGGRKSLLAMSGGNTARGPLALFWWLACGLFDIECLDRCGDADGRDDQVCPGPRLGGD